MAQDVKARNVLSLQHTEHVLCHGLRLISVIGLVAVGESPKIWGNKRKPISKLLNDGQELTVVLRPTMHTQNGGTTACRDVMQVHAICADALVRQSDGVLRVGRISRLL
jgi:hypothetical protein